jgi:Predicted oxidoreductases of the aldo/keto reductase family
MKRRTFFGSAAAGLAAAAPVPDAGKLKAGDIPRRMFGKTGESLTIIGPAGGRFHLAGFEDAKAITQRAYDLGINYFDKRTFIGADGRRRCTAKCSRRSARRCS